MGEVGSCPLPSNKPSKKVKTQSTCQTLNTLQARNLRSGLNPKSTTLKKVRSISGNTFEWNEKTHNKGKEVGVIAQEIEKLELPGVTTTRQDGTKAVRYEKLVPLLIEAIKELKDEINQIKANLSVS